MSTQTIISRRPLWIGRIVWLPPAYVVRREGNVLTRVCPSVSPQGGGGVSQPTQPGGVSPAGGGQSSRGGSVQPGGISPARGEVGHSAWGGWGGSGQSARGRGVSRGEGVSQDRTTEWVLTTRRAVCLLRSRRRTFLLELFSLTTIPQSAFSIRTTCVKRPNCAVTYFVERVHELEDSLGNFKHYILHFHL